MIFWFVNCSLLINHILTSKTKVSKDLNLNYIYFFFHSCSWQKLVKLIIVTVITRDSRYVTENLYHNYFVILNILEVIPNQYRFCQVYHWVSRFFPFRTGETITCTLSTFFFIYYLIYGRFGTPRVHPQSFLSSKSNLHN